MSLATYLIYKDTEMKFHTLIQYNIAYMNNIKLDIYTLVFASCDHIKVLTILQNYKNITKNKQYYDFCTNANCTLILFNCY